MDKPASIDLELPSQEAEKKTLIPGLMTIVLTLLVRRQAIGLPKRLSFKQPTIILNQNNRRLLFIG